MRNTDPELESPATFEDARLEIVTYVEAKFGLRIRDSKLSDTGARGHSDPTDVDAVISLIMHKEKGHQVRAMGVAGAVEHPASNRLAKANRASHCPRVKLKESVKRGKIQKTVQRIQRCQKLMQGQNIKNWSLRSLKTRNQGQARKLRKQRKWDLFVPLTRHEFMMNGVLTNGTTAGVLRME